MIRFQVAEKPITMKVSDKPLMFSVDTKPVAMRVNEKKISMSVAPAVPVYVGGELYEGSYDVEPTFSAQELPTKGKILLDNVTVNAIRVERVSNTHGTTVYIGMKGD